LFKNIAKPGAHPKFAGKDDSSSTELGGETSPVQELKETNKKPELTENDKNSGIVSDITSHNTPAHHIPTATFIGDSTKIKLVNPVTEAKKDQEAKQEN